MKPRSKFCLLARQKKKLKHQKFHQFQIVAATIILKKVWIICITVKAELCDLFKIMNDEYMLQDVLIF